MDAASAEKERTSLGFWSFLLQAPFDFVWQYLRRYTPNLVSLSVFLIFIPIICTISLSAGVIVWSNVAVGWQIPLYLQYGDAVQPYAHAVLEDLSSRQTYNIVLQLVVPSTDANFALGNFMNSLRLSTINNETLAIARRPAIVIPPKSPYFSGKPHLATIDIPMLDSFVPGSTKVTVDVKIGRQDVWRSLGHGEGRELNVYSASLKGILAHKGIRGLVTRFPTVFSVICSAIFFAILFSILAACLLPSILGSTSSNNIIEPSKPFDGSEHQPSTVPAEGQFPDDSSSTETDASDQQEEQEAKPSKSARRRKRRSAKNKNASEASSVKSESDTVYIPSDPVRSANPLRRRRSGKRSDAES